MLCASFPETSPAQSAEKKMVTVDVWWVPLDTPPDRVHTLEAILSAGERERAARFRSEQLRTRYCVAHGALRQILALDMGVDPADIRFETGPFGKPALAPEIGPGRPHFNLAHSEELALVAISRCGPVGIDVERCRAGIDVAALAEQCLHPGEARRILSLPHSQQARAFLTCWTRKEAYLKATGHGLSAPLDSFEVTVHPDEAPRLLSPARAPTEKARWRLVDLGDKDWAATLAVGSPVPTIARHAF